MNKPATRRKFAKQFGALMERKHDAIARALPESVDPGRFVDVAQTAAVQNEDLQNCTMESLYLAVKRCAQAGLMPDGDESAIVRYGEEAQWMPMVKGIVRLMLRSPDVAKVEARVVREGDSFEYQQGLRPRLDHKPRSQPSGKNFDPSVTHSYAIVFWRHLPPEQATFEVLPREDIEAARNQSRASGSPAWRNFYGEMARKVALHRVSKYVDLSPEAKQAIEQDIAVGWEGRDAPMSGGSVEEKLEEETRQRTRSIKGRLAENGGSESSDQRDPSGDQDEPEPAPAQAEGAPEGEGEPDPPTRDEAREQYLSVLRDYADGPDEVNTLRKRHRERADGLPDGENEWTTEHYLDAAKFFRTAGQDYARQLLEGEGVEA